MKFRLKIGHLYGPLSPDLNGGRNYGMYMIPWIKSVKEALGTGLKETKSLADVLRDSVERRSGVRAFNGDFCGATVIVDAAQFPFLIRHVHMPEGTSEYVEVIKDERPGLACTVGLEPYEVNPTAEVIKEALLKLIDMHSWNEARSLCDILEDIDNAQSV